MKAPIIISMVADAIDTATRDAPASKIIAAIQQGKWKNQVEQIRRLYAKTILRTGDPKAAKEAVAPLKKKLPGVLWPGTFSSREKPVNDKLITHSGLLCADLDHLGSEELKAVRQKLLTSPYLWALFCSPTGRGLKAIFRVPADPSKHLASFRAIEKHVRELAGVQIDQSGKDVSRICFVSSDPDCYWNPDAAEIEPLPEPLRLKVKVKTNGAINLNERQRIAAELLGTLDWQSETSGFCTCPGKHLHTTGDNDRDCKIELDTVPTVHCFHNHCRGIVDGVNHELRSRIGKVEYKHQTPPDEAESSVDVDLQGTCEISDPNEPPPAPYVPPPLNLLPSVLQDYIHASAESLNVDVALILLPLLSSLGAAIGNSRAIWLKRGFIQYPVIWTGIIGRSGSRKSPAQHEACFAVLEHEQELMIQNKAAMELYEEELAGWERKKPNERAGSKPEKPSFLACRCDDLTVEVLADILVTNPRGVLVQKDELSHFFASFDQYKHARGSDVSRWLSLHTAVSLAVDRRTDSRHYRIAYPHVSITGGIQPRILQRTLTSEYFERGLPARFIFAYPPFRQDRWNETTVPDDLHRKVWDLFSELWLLQPNNGVPLLLPIEGEAKEVYVHFYNQCGVTAFGADEHEEAVWSKLTGYGGRLDLVGQLAHAPGTEKISDGVIMEAACRFALWAGNEATRIYATLAETEGQRERRELIEFIIRRGGTVYEREVMQSFLPLKNDKKGTERELTTLVKAGIGKWEPVNHGGGPGRPARKF